MSHIVMAVNRNGTVDKKVIENPVRGGDILVEMKPSAQNNNSASLYVFLYLISEIYITFLTWNIRSL